MIPATRGDCINGPRPCPHVTCRHHTASDLVDDPEALKVFVDALAPNQTCSLDLAELGGMTLEEVGQIFGITRERIRQIESKALRRLGWTTILKNSGILTYVPSEAIEEWKGRERYRRQQERERKNPDQGLTVQPKIRHKSKMWAKCKEKMA